MDLNGTVVISLLYAAQKYQLPELLSKCEVFLSEHLDVKNACTIYSQAKVFSMTKLKKSALEFIAQNTMKIFNSEDFLSLSPANLLDILQLDSLCISEVNVFRSVLEWAESKLLQSKHLITGESRRRIMLQCNILYMIGVPLLTLEEYTTVVVQSDVLTDQEQLCVFKAITMKIIRFLKLPPDSEYVHGKVAASLIFLWMQFYLHVQTTRRSVVVVHMLDTEVHMIIMEMAKMRSCILKHQHLLGLYQPLSNQGIEISYSVLSSEKLHVL